MAITFNTNLAALGAQRNIGIASNAASSSLSKLSSGSRIPQAKDDAAGLAIGSKLKSEVAGLTQASNNAAQAISLLQIADGALSTLGDILQRMKALAVQSSSGQLDDASRSLLNQEFSNLQKEVDRVANVTNFNGTSLLAGSTKVQAKVNDLGAGNLIGQGFDSIDFGQDAGDGALKISYDHTSRVMTVTDLKANKTQSITLDAGAIAVGDTENYNFGDVGVKIGLNSNFNKATDIAASSVVTSSISATNAGNFSATASAIGTWGLTGPTAIASAITTLNFGGTGTDALSASVLDGKTLTASGGFAAVTLGDLVVSGHTFHTATTHDFTSAGTGTYLFDDGVGNSFTVTLTTTGAASAGTATGTVALAQTAVSGAIENTGTGANAPSIIAITQATPDPITGLPKVYNFGDVDVNKVTLDFTAAATTGASITLKDADGNNVIFNTTLAGGATADTTTAGVKTLKLSDGNGNSFTLQFNVTAGFHNGDSAAISVGQFGQLVGSDSVTSGSTTFNFKVGTGTTANDKISFDLNSATTTALGINSDDITTAANSDIAIGHVNSAITAVASRRADVGAAQSRLDFASSSISVAIENTTAAQSALLDVDVSAEITNFTNENVLMQAGISLLSQANQQPALLLRLLQ